MTFGRYTYGFSPATGSVADPLSGLISDPTRKREFVFRGLPSSGGTPVNVDLSGSGYKSKSTDSPHQLFPEGIQRPYNFTVNLPLPDMSGGAQLGVGDFLASNNDGSLDSAALMDWLGAQAEVYMGPPEPASFTTFTQIFKGVAAGLTWDLGNISLLHRNFRFKLENRLQQHRYTGTGAAVKCDGADDYLSGTPACPAGSMTIEASAYTTLVNGAAHSLIGWRNGTSAGLRLLYIRGSDNTVAISVRNDAGTLYEAAFAPALNVWARWAGVLDVPNLEIRLYKDGALVATTAVTGTFNTVTANFAAGKLPDAASAYWSGGADELRVWSAPRLAAEIQANDHELIGTETSLAHYWKLNEGSGTTAANTVGGGPSLTLNGGVTWIGSLEGDSSLAATPKPVALGKRRQVAPRLVDSQRLVYQFHDGPLQAIDALRDSGDPITFGADVADIYGSTPGAGTYNTCLDEGLARLGSSPVGVITGDIRGDNSGSLGYVSTAAGVHRKAVTTYGGLADPTDLDVAAYTALDALNDAVIGLYFDTDINVDAAADQAVNAIRAWWAPTRVGTATVGRIDDPSTQTPTVAWTHDDLDRSRSQPYRREPMGLRVGEVIIGYRPYHTTLTPDQIAGAVSLADRDDFGKQYRYVSSKDPDRTADADTVTILTDMDEAADAQAEADRLREFLKRDLDKVAVSLDAGSLAHFIGTIVSLEITQTGSDGVSFARYNTSGGKPYVVVGIAEDMGQSGSPDSLEATLVG